MFSVGDRIIYGSLGVVDIIDIREECVGGAKRLYYVLSEVFGKANSLTFVPTDSEKLTSAMRPIPEREEIERIIAEAKEREVGEWIDDGRARAEHFRSVISSGDRVELILMIKQIRLMSRRLSAEGKRLYVADENMMKRAERQVYPEISAALGIPESDIPHLFMEKSNCKDG